MRFDVKFKESNQRFDVSFGEVQNISDGGYERGYAAGYAAAEEIWTYVKGISGMFNYAVFPAGTGLVINVPNLSDTAMSYFLRGAIGIESITLTCNARNLNLILHGAFQRCPDLKHIDLTNFNRVFYSASDLFYNSPNLEEIIGELDVSSVTKFTLWFHGVTKLREIRFKPESIKYEINFPSTVLSDESIQSIINGLADLTDGTTTKLVLSNEVKTRLTSEQLTTIAAKNWTV